MCPLWQPALPPPKMERFAELSPFAQKVMKSIYLKYQEEKRRRDEMEEMQSLHKRRIDSSSSSSSTSTQSLPSSSYYQNIYRRRFKADPNMQSPLMGIVTNHIDPNIQPPAPELATDFNMHVEPSAKDFVHDMCDSNIQQTENNFQSLSASCVCEPTPAYVCSVDNDNSVDYDANAMMAEDLAAQVYDHDCTCSITMGIGNTGHCIAPDSHITDATNLEKPTTRVTAKGDHSYMTKNRFKETVSAAIPHSAQNSDRLKDYKASISGDSSTGGVRERRESSSNSQEGPTLPNFTLDFDAVSLDQCPEPVSPMSYAEFEDYERRDPSDEMILSKGNNSEVNLQLAQNPLCFYKEQVNMVLHEPSKTKGPRKSSKKGITPVSNLISKKLETLSVNAVGAGVKTLKRSDSAETKLQPLSKVGSGPSKKSRFSAPFKKPASKTDESKKQGNLTIPSMFGHHNPVTSTNNQKDDEDVADNSLLSPQYCDYSLLNKGEQQRVLQGLCHSPQVLVALLLSDGSSSLRTLGAKSSKRKTSTPQRPVSAEICGISLLAFPCNDNDNCRGYLPLNITEDNIRFVCDQVFCNKKIAVCVEAKNLLTYLQEKDVQHKYLCIHDPTIAFWLLNPDAPEKTYLSALASVSLSPKESLCTNAKDMLKTDFLQMATLMERLKHKLMTRELWDLFENVECRITPLLAEMESQYVVVNTEKMREFSEILKKKMLKLQKKAYDIVGHSFLINSPSQLRQILFEQLKLDQQLKAGKGKLARTSIGHQASTSEAVLHQLSGFHPLPGVILEYRQVQKLKSTYVDGMLQCVHEGKLRTHWDQTSAATGRLSSYQPNVQSIPKTCVTISDFNDNFIIGRDTCDAVDIYARDIICSHDGWTFLAADFQQIELRLLAHLTGDPELLNLFHKAQDSDIFTELTSQWLSKGSEEVTGQEREQTKRIVYSVMYGVGKEKLGEYLKISPDAAKGIMDSFLVRFPAVNRFTQQCIKFCEENGFTKTIFKRRRLLPNISSSHAPHRAQAARQAVNFCVQGSAADLCKAAMLNVVDALRRHSHLKVKLLFQIHDELLFEVADEDLIQAQNMVRTVMEDRETLCGHFLDLKVPIRVSLSCGKSWGQMAPATG